MLQADQSEYTLKVSIDGRELQQLLALAAQTHLGKAKMFRDRASQISAAGEQPLEGDEELQSSYTSKVNTKLDDAKEGLIQQARLHETQAKLKQFLAAHVDLTINHILTAEQVRQWDLAGS